jgi:hypothetical protein
MWRVPHEHPLLGSLNLTRARDQLATKVGSLLVLLGAIALAAASCSR